MMKLSSSAILASILAASTAALSSSNSNSNSNSYVQELRERKDAEISLEKEKFAPRFDGLRFIETLVTAHRNCIVCGVVSDDIANHMRSLLDYLFPIVGVIISGPLLLDIALCSIIFDESGFYKTVKVLVDWLNQPRPVDGTPILTRINSNILPDPPGLLTISM